MKIILPRWVVVGSLALGISTGSYGVPLWYNGDFNDQDAIANAENAAVNDARAYDDFGIPNGQTWSINSVWSNNLVDDSGLFSTAHWEIRSGVSAGNGGSLLASGTDSATLTATGRSGFGLNEYTVQVNGLNVNLGAGTYWLTVAPVSDVQDSGFSYNSTTSGLNSVGTPAGNNSNAFYDSVTFSYAFEPTSLVGPNPNFTDFSMGIDGNSFFATGVPEPSTVMLLVLGGGALLRLHGRRRNK